MTKVVDPAVSAYMAKIGAKGGKRGRGKKKARSPEVYQKMAEAKKQKRGR